MKFIQFFKDLNKDSVEIAGGKGASLGEMYSSNIPVPNGFVVLSSAYKRFLEETDLNVEITSILKTVKIKDVSTIEKASEKIQALINLKEMPKDISKEIISSFKKLKTKHVAVRSSATSEDSKSAAWAGQLDTFLNTNEKRLIENVKRCFASLFTPRAIFYRFEKKLHKKEVSVAVVIQKMVDSEKSGIAFSVHPVTENYNQMIIEAGYGLGEAIVSGQITPDSYVVSKDKFEILDKNINIQEKALYKCLRKGTKWKKLDKQTSKSQVLSDKEIIELSKVIKKIENHYGFPCDIEWAIEKNKIYITQSRPITTLKNKIKIKKEKNTFDDIKLTKLYTRERTLFFNYLEYMGNYKCSDKKIVDFSLDNFIYINKNNSNSYWYDLNSINNIHQNIIDKYNSDNKYISYISKLHDVYWDKVKSYFKLEKDIKSLKELKEFLDNTWRFLNYMSVFYVSPNISGIDNKFKKISLEYREKTQHYINNVDIVFRNLINNKFKKYKEYSDYISPSEVFILFKRDFTKKELEVIKNRKENGYIFYKGKVYSYNKLKIILKKDNLELPSEYKVQLHKEHSREYSLSRVYACNKMFTHYFKYIKAIGYPLKYNCLIYNGIDLVDSYYNQKELFTAFKYIEKQINEDYSKANDLMDNFEKIYFNLKEYLKHNKFITSVKEYKFVLENHSNYWTHVDFLLVFSDELYLKAPKNIKQRALKLREKTQEYNESLEPLFKNFIETKYPYLEGKYRFVLPDDIFNGDVKNKSLMLKKIKQREKGFVYYQGKLYAGDVNKTLDKLGLIIESYNQIDSNKIQLHKEHSRQYSLSRLNSLFNGMTNYINDIVGKNTKNMCGLYNKDTCLFDIYYYNTELQTCFKFVKDQAVKDNSKAIKNINRFYELFNILYDYYSKKKKINTVKEYKDICKVYSEYCAYVAITYLYPVLKINNNINKKSLFAREKTQEYNESLEPIFKEFIETKYSYLKGKYRFVLPDDIFNGDVKNKSLMLKKIKQREKGFVYYQGKLYTGDVNKTLDKLGLMLEKQNTQVQEIKGQIGYKGKVKGKVKIITSINQIKDFKQGEVMVSPMTMPNYLPAMKKAAAFVTDEGGITCHAAIVSRELKKPCVIGTKIATQVLKDGDYVEVDANKGVVKILKKGSNK